MPLFTKQGSAVLYIHVPKTGGTSIEQFFITNGFTAEYLDRGGAQSFNQYRRCSPQHMHAEPLMAILRPARCNYVFATVREPLARIVSEYKMRARGHAQFPPLPLWLAQSMKRYVDDEYVLDNHLRPQVQFLIPGCEVFRQEDGFGSELVERVETQLQVQLERRSIMHQRFKRQVSVADEDIEQIRSRVRDVYWQDYAALYSVAKV